MNERIDVLVQLRTTYCPPECLEAIAELIEAAKDEQAQTCGNFAAKSCGHDHFCICPANRLRAALARVGGA